MVVLLIAYSKFSRILTVENVPVLFDSVCLVCCWQVSFVDCCYQPLLSASVLDNLIHQDKKSSAPMTSSPMDHAGLDNSAELQVDCLYFICRCLITKAPLCDKCSF